MADYDGPESVKTKEGPGLGTVEYNVLYCG